MTSEDIYVRALSSRALRPVVHKVTDIDVVIAAGVVGESLATALWRLRAEFDATKSDLKQRMQKQRDQFGQIKTKGLRGFGTARQATLNYVVQVAHREKLGHCKLNYHRITEHALLVLLSPVCDRCDGTRFKLIPGTQHLSAHACTLCSGSGLRPLHFPRNTRMEEIQLTRAVLASIDRKMDSISSRISAYLRQQGQGQ